MKNKFLIILLFIFLLIVQGASATTFKIMPLGDSITAADYSCYEKYLWDLLASAGYSIDFVGSQTSICSGLPDKNHEGHAGMTTAQINASLDTWLDQNTPQYVILHIGTNDATGTTSTATSQLHLSSIIDKIYAHSSTTKILVATIITVKDCLNVSWLPVSCGYAAEIRTFNNMLIPLVNSKIASGKPVYLVDMYNESTIGVSDLVADGIHPNQYGAAKMGKVWFNHLNSLLIRTTLTLPIITDYSNTKSNDNSTSITINTSKYVTFNFAANQTVTAHWSKDGVGVCSNSMSCNLSWSTNGSKSVTTFGSNANGSTSTITWAIQILPVETNPSKIGIGGATWEGYSTMNNLYADNQYVKPGVYRDNFEDGTYDFSYGFGNLSIINGKLRSYGLWADLYKNIGNQTDTATFLKLTETNVSKLQIFVARSDTSRASVGRAYKAVLRGNGTAEIELTNTTGSVITLNTTTFVRTNNVESSYVFKTCGNNQKFYASATSSYQSALANLIGSGTNNEYTYGNGIALYLAVINSTNSNLVDDVRVLKTDPLCNIFHSGNLTAHYEADSNNVVEAIIVNASVDSDYTLEYHEYQTSNGWVSLGTNLSGNQTKNTINGSKYRNTEVRIISFFNDTSSPEIRTIEFSTEPAAVSKTYPRYDVNEDGIVDINDLTLFSRYFNEAVSILYLRYDVNMDGLVNIADVTLVSQHFGEKKY